MRKDFGADDACFGVRIASEEPQLAQTENSAIDALINDGIDVLACGAYGAAEVAYSSDHWYAGSYVRPLLVGVPASRSLPVGEDVRLVRRNRGTHVVEHAMRA